MAITPHPLIGFASEYMRWKALLRDFPLNGVLSTTTHDIMLAITWYAKFTSLLLVQELAWKD
jgi:hypothetical protein